MALRIFAIVLIVLGASIGWIVLGATIFARTGDSESALSDKVASTWGTNQEQRPPVT